MAFIPTGGITVDNLPQWRNAGAAALGAGSELCSNADMAAGRWDTITTRTRAFSDALQEVNRD